MVLEIKCRAGLVHLQLNQVISRIPHPTCLAAAHLPPGQCHQLKEKWESAHRLANFKNLVILRVIGAAGADAVEGSSHRFAYCTNSNCEDPSTRLRSLRMTGAFDFWKTVRRFCFCITVLQCNTIVLKTTLPPGGRHAAAPPTAQQVGFFKSTMPSRPEGIGIIQLAVTGLSVGAMAMYVEPTP